MKKFLIREIKWKPLDIHDIDDRLLMLNLYLTQGLTLLIGLVLIAFQRINPLQILSLLHWKSALLGGAGFAAAVLAIDLFLSKWVPEEVADDGGINERLFASRPVLQIVLLSFIVAFCEEMLFRGAIQHAWGPYWTSILFAAIHIRYLRHWLMTGLVFGISYGLGWIYDATETLWCPIIAHFLIDLSMGLILRFRKEK